MNREQFEQILDALVSRLSVDAQNGDICRDSKKFESAVLSELQKLCAGHRENAASAFHNHAFPDLVVNGFGVEVKHTTKDSWLAVGNSIFEGMRDKTAEQIYVVYGKMGGWPEVRWARYEDCVTHVRISHAPRFVVEMESPTPFFKNIGVSYQEFSALSASEKMTLVRQYARGRLQPGEQLWWLEDLEEQPHALPMEIKIFRHLPNDTKRKLRAEATLLCPEVVRGGRVRGKYDRAGLYMMTQYGVFAPQLRDVFSAGSVGAKDGSRGHKYIVHAIQDIESEMLQAAQYLDDNIVAEYWSEPCPADKRISTWLDMADEHASDWKPSEELFAARKTSGI